MKYVAPASFASAQTERVERGDNKGLVFLLAAVSSAKGHGASGKSPDLPADGQPRGRIAVPGPRSVFQPDYRPGPQPGPPINPHPS